MGNRAELWKQVFEDERRMKQEILRLREIIKDQHEENVRLKQTVTDLMDKLEEANEMLLMHEDDVF